MVLTALFSHSAGGSSIGASSDFFSSIIISIRKIAARFQGKSQHQALMDCLAAAGRGSTLTRNPFPYPTPKPDFQAWSLQANPNLTL